MITQSVNYQKSVYFCITFQPLEIRVRNRRIINKLMHSKN
jgi:hypothetical protein